MKLHALLSAIVVASSLLAGCAGAMLPGEAAANDVNDPGHKTMNEFVAKVGTKPPEERIALFKAEYEGKALEVTVRVDNHLTNNLVCTMPPEQHAIFALFTPEDKARAMAIPDGTFIRIRGTMAETIERNSVSLDRTSIVTIY